MCESSSFAQVIIQAHLKDSGALSHFLFHYWASFLGNIGESALSQNDHAPVCWPVWQIDWTENLSTALSSSKPHGAKGPGFTHKGRGSLPHCASVSWEECSSSPFLGHYLLAFSADLFGLIGTRTGDYSEFQAFDQHRQPFGTLPHLAVGGYCKPILEVLRYLYILHCSFL